MPDESPPQAPGLRRKLRFGRLQAVGIVAMFSIPLLALAGVFGESWETTRAQSPDLSIHVEYPERFRYKQINKLVVSIENRGAETMDSVMVAFDPAYVLAFSGPLFIPSASQAFRVPLTQLEPGDTELILLKIQGEKYGRHSGDIRVWNTRGDSLAVTVSTFIFP